MVSGFRGSSQNTWPLSLLPLPSSFLITTWSNRQSCFRRSMGTSSGHWNWDGGKDQRQLSYGTFITYRINREKWETCHFLARGGVVFALSCCTGPRRYCQNKINSQLLSKFTIPVTTDCYLPCFRCHSYLLLPADRHVVGGGRFDDDAPWLGCVSPPGFWRCQSAAVIDHFASIKILCHIV